MKETVKEYYSERARSIGDGDVPSFGVGDPVALAQLRDGETVLDLGSGPGHDLFAAARAVGPTGRAIGIDMTAEMLERSRATATTERLDNVSVLEGDLERLPLPCGSVDVVISNCVINLVDDKRRALVEAFRVLRPGGRLAVMDTAFESEPDPSVRQDEAAWACCVGGALVASDYEAILQDIGFEDVTLEFQDASCGASCSAGEVTARSIAVRAGKPASAGEAMGVRPAVPADLPAITALLGAEGLPLDGLQAHNAIVLLEDGTIAGAVAVERYGTAALLRSLVVDPARRGRLLGRRLVASALEVARWAGASEVFLATTGNQKLFRAAGFEPVSLDRAKAACPSPEFEADCCSTAAAMRLSFEEADLPVLGTPSRKPLPTFEGGRCC